MGQITIDTRKAANTGAVLAAALVIAFAGYSRITGHESGRTGPQALVDQSKAEAHRSVNRLSRLDGSDRAMEVVSYNPLAQLGGTDSASATLAELGQFSPADPAFRLQIQAPDIDVALSSLQQIYAQLDTDDAQALDFAVRFLAVTQLKGADFAAYGQDPSAIPDSALFKHILPLIDGKTPMQVMVSARAEQVRLDRARQQVPVDPFDRIEMERKGQLPGMTIPR